MLRQTDCPRCQWPDRLDIIRENGASHPGRGKFIDCHQALGRRPTVAAIRHKQIAPAVKGQSKWVVKPEANAVCTPVGVNL